MQFVVLALVHFLPPFSKFKENILGQSPYLQLYKTSPCDMMVT
jgi:hypothetical protein